MRREKHTMFEWPAQSNRRSFPPIRAERASLPEDVVSSASSDIRDYTLPPISWNSRKYHALLR